MRTPPRRPRTSQVCRRGVLLQVHLGVLKAVDLLQRGLELVQLHPLDFFFSQKNSDNEVPLPESGLQTKLVRKNTGRTAADVGGFRDRLEE